MPMKKIKEAKIRGSREYDRQWSGRAYLQSMRFVCTMGKDTKPQEVAHLIIHEVGHLATYWHEVFGGGNRTRRNGESWGGSEEHIEHYTRKFVREIGIQEICDWHSEEILAFKKSRSAEQIPKKTAVQKRADRAAAGLVRWELKLEKSIQDQKMAEKRLREFRKKVSYYRKKGVLE